MHQSKTGWKRAKLQAREDSREETKTAMASNIEQIYFFPTLLAHLTMFSLLTCLIQLTTVLPSHYVTDCNIVFFYCKAINCANNIPDIIYTALDWQCWPGELQPPKHRDNPSLEHSIVPVPAPILPFSESSFVAALYSIMVTLIKDSSWFISWMTPPPTSVLRQWAMLQQGTRPHCKQAAGLFTCPNYPNPLGTILLRKVLGLEGKRWTQMSIEES